MAMCPENYMTGVLPNEKDKEIKEHYLQLASTDWSKKGWNAADCYLVDEEPFKKTNLYPSKQGENLHKLMDKYRHDFDLRLKWSDIHSVLLYKAVSENTELPSDLSDKVAEDLHPYYYYIKRTETACGKDGCESWPVYLLVEAHTIQGWYQYHYEQETKTYKDGSSYTYWALKDTIQLYPDRHQFFKDYIKKFYDISKPEKIDLASEWILQASTGFFEKKRWVEWLSDNFKPSAYASEAMIPPEFWDALREAEEKFGVPAWFMAALIEKESSWDPLAINPKTGCFGLTQMHPDYYEERWRALGFDPVLDKWNPRAQILAGAKLLIEYSGSVDWSDWKNDANLKRGLAKYGGYESVSDAESYIADIFSIAGNISVKGVQWPVHGRITSYFWEPRESGNHTGIDIAVPEGTEVKSASAGIVYYTGYSSVYGNHIKIRDSNHEYLYAHLNEILVNAKDIVSPGEVIGLSGNTGNSTGPHLHFSVKDLNSNRYIDPLILLGNAN